MGVQKMFLGTKRMFNTPESPKCKADTGKVWVWVGGGVKNLYLNFFLHVLHKTQ